MKRAFLVLAAAASSRWTAAGIPGQTRVTGGIDSEREFFSPLLLANVSDAELSVEPALTATQDGDIPSAAESVRLQP